MEIGNSAEVAEIQRLRDTAWEAIGSATVGKSERSRYWKAWTKHCQLYKASSSGEPPPDTANMLLTFAVAVREGQYGLGRQVQVQSVSKALRTVAQKYVLDGYPDPRKSSPAQHNLDLPLARLLKKYNDEDPPAEPKLAVPVSTVRKICKRYKFSDHHRAVADLCTIAFFYLLRVGEYTTPSKRRQREKRTTALRKCDIRLWRNNKLLPHNAPLSDLLEADSATICLAKTKNGVKGAVVHQEAIGGAVCPVAALARRIHNIKSAPQSCPISMVFHRTKQPTRVSDRDITIAVRWGAVNDNLLNQGYTLERVSSHSLRAGGAMALKLAGATTDTIMRMGRWTSNTYMTYIHAQIGALTKGIAWKMSRNHTFHNVG
jgi:hypothetical protein